MQVVVEALENGCRVVFVAQTVTNVNFVRSDSTPVKVTFQTM